jgi:translation elongation factor EF-4
LGNNIYTQEGIGITEILDAIVQRIPAPLDTAGKPLRALIFDRFALVVFIHNDFCLF